MTDVAEASLLLKEIAGERQPVERAIERAAHAVAKFIPTHWKRRWHYGRAEDIWREAVPGVWSTEMDAIRAAHYSANYKAWRKRKEAVAHDSIAAATASLRTLHQAYANTDPEFFREQMGAIERAVFGSSDDAADVGESGGA